MNIAYIRKSDRSVEDILKSVKEYAKENGWQYLGETELKSLTGYLVSLTKTKWIEDLINIDSNLVGLMPTSLFVFEKDKEVFVGSGEPGVLGGLTRNPQVQAVSSTAEEAVKDLVHFAAGVEALKPTGIKLYATTTCPHCKREEAWLKDNDVEFDMILVDLNQEEAQRLVQKTGQMGVPVTEVIYDDAESDFIVGFNQPELEKVLNINS